jgi:hypothetical protein
VSVICHDHRLESLEAKGDHQDGRTEKFRLFCVNKGQNEDQKHEDHLANLRTPDIFSIAQDGELSNQHQNVDQKLRHCEDYGEEDKQVMRQTYL